MAAIEAAYAAANTATLHDISGAITERPDGLA